jgi:glycosyltransferase involved in cell wall biosynthesis
MPPSCSVHHARTVTTSRITTTRDARQRSSDTSAVLPRAAAAQRRRPRLLVLITLAETGGAGSYVAGLLPALASRFDVVVAAHGDGPLVDAARATGVRFVGLRHVRRALSPARDLLGLVELIALIRRERPDIVHVNSSKAGVLGRMAAMLAGAPITVFTVHGWAFKAYSGVAAALYRFADRLMARATSVTICVTEAERAAGLAAGTCAASRTTVIPNAIDVAASPRAQPHPDAARIVSVGRLSWPKDPITLVRALARVRHDEVIALVVGDGPQRADVEAEAHRLGLDSVVQLVGPREDVPDLLARGDIFVLASRSEGGPISVLEAMAAGLPVVASDVGGVGELVDEGATGLLVPPADPEALGAALQRLLDDAGLRRRMGAAGRQRVAENFDVGAQRRAHLELYARELARHGAPSFIP